MFEINDNVQVKQSGLIGKVVDIQETINNNKLLFVVEFSEYMSNAFFEHELISVDK